MTRNILDKDGNIIGELTLPDETTEEEWTAKLAQYSDVPVEVKVYPDVTPRQMRQALVLSGVTAQQITDAINTLEEPMKSLAMIEWEYSTAFQRRRPLVAQVGLMLGWTEEQLDNLWALAGSL